MEETLLYKAASVWQTVSQYRYRFVYGYKSKLYTINLTFPEEGFFHLAGFQYLKDLSLPRYSSAKTISKILDGTITQQQVEKGLRYEEMVRPRLLALVKLEEILDNEFKFYSYKPLYYPFVTKIQADYLIASRLDGVSFVFLIRSDGNGAVSECSCSSIFIKDDRDYAQNQRSFALMKKTKTQLSNNSTRVLFLKDGFADPEAPI